MAVIAYSGAVLVLSIAIAVTLFGFVPTGLLSVAHGVSAWSDHRRGDLDSARRRRRIALRWCLISIVIGAMVEAPVVATLVVAQF